MLKKSLLFVVALLASCAMSFAQDNLALGGTAKATYGIADLAIDGDNGTRWEAGVGDFNNQGSENCDWILDMGEAKTFNTIQIRWEGAYSKSFTLSVSNDDANYNDVYIETDKELTGFPAEMTYNVGEQTARYIKFSNVARGSQWGVSFFEFRVYEMEASKLTSIDLSADKTWAKVGESVTLTAQGKDQIGGNMDAGEVAYEVTPASAGTVANGVYTPSIGGAAKIVAKVGDVVSNEVTVEAYTGEKINIFANWQNMVASFGDKVTDGSMVGAFDDNMGSLWDMHAGTADDEASRTYEVGFVVDFAALYDITAVSICFEGACSADYQVIAVHNDGTETVVYTEKDHPGMATYTENILASVKEVRKIKFVSTKAATQYGIKIFDFSVYGENKQDLPDTEAPYDVTATYVENSASFASVSLSLKASDAVSSIITYEISYKEGEETKTVTATGQADVATTYTVGGLKANTEYTFSVVAKDAKGNAAQAVDVTAKTLDMQAAPEPMAEASDVFAVYTKKYGNVEGLNLNPDWGQATVETIVDIDGDEAIMLSNTNYQGIEFAKNDVTEYTYLHIDIYPVGDATSLRIVPIWRNSDDNGNYAEIPYVMGGLASNQWNSLDIPLTNFASDDRNGTNNVYQIKFDEGNNKTFMIDNIYFGIDKTAPEWDAEYPVIISNTVQEGIVIKVKATDNTASSKITFTVESLEEIVAEVATYGMAKVPAANQTITVANGEEGTITIPEPEFDKKYNIAISATDSFGNKVENKVIATGLVTSGIENVTEDANAPVEYFNLNGIRVDNPENGLYIRRAGSKVEKVFIR